MTSYPDVHRVLRMIHEHELVQNPDIACSPCDTTALAKALELDLQHLVNLLILALRHGQLIMATVTRGGVNPYLSDIRLTDNGRAAVQTHLP